MKKYFFVAVLLSGFCNQAFCQDNDALRIDSTRLDSLKRILPSLKDRARVDLMNLIGLQIGYNAGGSPQNRVDSSLFYASKAYTEAIKLGYKSGIALATVLLA